jgi:GTP pyrophosphokinase
LKYLSPEKQIKVARESLEVFGPMADKLGMGLVRMQIEEIAFSYLDPVQFKKLQILMKKRLGKSTRKLGKIRTEVETALKKHNINAEINGRVKSIYSLHKKLAKVDGNIDDIYDLMALRIVVDRKEDCYIVLGILHSLYKPMINRIKDYISTPKPNGYQSLHTTVMTPSEQIVEFQIRTNTMHEFAERGLAASFHYHDQKLTKNYIENKKSATLPNNMQWITQLQEVVIKLKDGDEISKNQLNIDLFGNRIFVHSPKGDIYDLPEGALPLDFAYLVHSDIAKHAYSFRVNGKIHAFDKPLQNGDIVEVITKRSSQPKQAWRQIVTTTHARSKLHGQLKQSGMAEIISNATKIIRRKPKK